MNNIIPGSHGLKWVDNLREELKPFTQETGIKSELLSASLKLNQIYY